MSTGAGKVAEGRALCASGFPGITPATRAALQSLCRQRTCRTGHTIVREGEATDFVGCVLSGVLRMQKTLLDGRQHIVGLLVDGDMFGRVFDGSVGFSIEAATDAEFCAFPRAEFEALLMKSPDLDRAVLLNMLNELDRARDWMIILSNQKITSRIAGFLLLMISRFSAVDHFVEESERGLEINIPVSRTDLAHLLGTRTESISRALHALEDEGDLRIVEPNRIRVLDIEALAAKAGEDEWSGMRGGRLSLSRSG